MPSNPRRRVRIVLVVTVSVRMLESLESVGLTRVTPT